MAARIANSLEKNSSIKIAYPVQTNQIFAYFPKDIIDVTQKEFFYYIWNEQTKLVRLVTSFDTTIEDVNSFTKIIEISGSNPAFG